MIFQFFVRKRPALFFTMRKSPEVRIYELIKTQGYCTKVNVYRKRIAQNAESAEIILAMMVKLGLLTTKEIPPLCGGHTQTLYESTDKLNDIGMKENYISAVDEVVDLKAKLELLDYQIRSYDRSERLAWKRVHELEDKLNERDTINN
jgi:hypothetical protein